MAEQQRVYFNDLSLHVLLPYEDIKFLEAKGLVVWHTEIYFEGWELNADLPVIEQVLNKELPIHAGMDYPFGDGII